MWNFFKDNFDLVLLNNLFYILRSFVHSNVLLKLSWRKHFLKTIYRLTAINFVVSYAVFLQKQPPEVFLEMYQNSQENTCAWGLQLY